MPFPQDAKIAFVDIQVIAQASAEEGRIDRSWPTLNKKKKAELNEKTKQLQALQHKLRDRRRVMNDTARAQLEKDIDKPQRDIQFTQQDAQAEIQELQNELQGDFQKKLIPILEAGRQGEGPPCVFSIADSGVVYLRPGPGPLGRGHQAVRRGGKTAR